MKVSLRRFAMYVLPLIGWLAAFWATPPRSMVAAMAEWLMFALVCLVAYRSETSGRTRPSEISFSLILAPVVGVIRFSSTVSELIERHGPPWKAFAVASAMTLLAAPACFVALYGVVRGLIERERLREA
ncbi:MAG: hypothetical protein JST51_05100 [Armatimonadetes bacterium]|nr:hypothetical protein [Armatimonadota bacterium]